MKDFCYICERELESEELDKNDGLCPKCAEGEDIGNQVHRKHKEQKPVKGDWQ